MPDGFRTLWPAALRPAVRAAIVASLALVLGACATTPDPGDAGERLAPQASGSFSGGSLSRGSVEGFFEGVGLGNELHRLEMTVDGVLWFECKNNGGNLAPGQFAFTTSVSELIEGDIDDNGRFETDVSTDDADEDERPDDDDCKNNWTVDTEDGEKVTFIQVADVTAKLYEIQDDGDLVHRDTLRWTCDDPEPTSPISEYEGPPLTGEGGVCTLVEG